MLIRSNGLYRPRFEWSRRGLLLITKRWIFATRREAQAWR